MRAEIPILFSHAIRPRYPNATTVFLHIVPRCLSHKFHNLPSLCLGIQLFLHNAGHKHDIRHLCQLSSRVYLLNPIFHTSLDFAGFDIAIYMNFLCSERYDEYWDIDLREEFSGDDIYSSNIKNIPIRSQSNFLRRFKASLPNRKGLSLEYQRTYRLRKPLR